MLSHSSKTPRAAKPSEPRTPEFFSLLVTAQGLLDTATEAIECVERACAQVLLLWQLHDSAPWLKVVFSESASHWSF